MRRLLATAAEVIGGEVEPRSPCIAWTTSQQGEVRQARVQGGQRASRGRRDLLEHGLAPPGSREVGRVVRRGGGASPRSARPSLGLEEGVDGWVIREELRPGEGAGGDPGDLKMETPSRLGRSGRGLRDFEVDLGFCMIKKSHGGLGFCRPKGTAKGFRKEAEGRLLALS